MAGPAPPPAIGRAQPTGRTAIRHARKQDAAPNYKGGYGFHPIYCFTDATGETLGVALRPGNLPSRKVGSHRRITLADLLAYRDDMLACRRAGLDQMSRDAEELGLY